MNTGKLETKNTLLYSPWGSADVALCVRSSKLQAMDLQGMEMLAGKTDSGCGRCDRIEEPHMNSWSQRDVVATGIEQQSSRGTPVAT